MIKDKNTKHFVLGVLFGLILRFAYVNIPVLEVMSLSQMHYAMIARNFYFNEFNIFYPSFDYLNEYFSYMFFEFQLFPFLVSLFYYLLGDVYEWIGRLLSIIISMGTGYYIFRFSSDLYSKRAGVFSALVFFLSPLSIVYTRTFSPDSMILFFTVGTIYFCYKWLYQEKKRYYLYSIFFMMVLLLVRGLSIYLYFPVCYMIIMKYKKVNLKLIGYIALSIYIPLLFWISNINVYQIQIQNFSAHFSKLFSYDVFISSKYWIKYFERLGGMTLTPIGLFFLIRALFVNKKDNYSFLVIWLGSVIMFSFLNCNIFLEYKAYYLLLLVVCSIFIGKELAKENLGFNRNIYKFILTFSKVAVFFLIIVQIASAYSISTRYRYMYKGGKELQRFANKEDLVIATRRLYYCNRKGWVLSLDKEVSQQELIKEFKIYKNLGASYFVVTDIDEYTSRKEFMTYIMDTCQELIVEKGYRIYKL